MEGASSFILTIEIIAFLILFILCVGSTLSSLLTARSSLSAPTLGAAGLLRDVRKAAATGSTAPGAASALPTSGILSSPFGDIDLDANKEEAQRVWAKLDEMSAKDPEVRGHEASFGVQGKREEWEGEKDTRRRLSSRSDDNDRLA